MQGNLVYVQKKYSIFQELLGFWTLPIVQHSICCLSYADEFGHILCREVVQVSLLLGFVLSKLSHNNTVLYYTFHAPNHISCTLRDTSTALLLLLASVFVCSQIPAFVK
jgi:hypothetical protein